MVIVLIDYHLNIEQLIVIMSITSVINYEHFQSLQVHSLMKFKNFNRKTFSKSIIYIHIFLHHLMVRKIFVADHFVLIIEIDRDKNSLDQLNDDNNIVEEYELAENMQQQLMLLLIHQQIKTNAKKKEEFISRLT